MKTFAVVAAIVAVMSCSVVHASSLSGPVVRPGGLTARPAELAKLEGLILDADSFPATDGSTSAEPLGVWVAARLLGLHCRWQSAPFQNERRLLPVEYGDRDDENDVRTLWVGPLPLYEQKLRHRGTHTAYRRLIEGKADLIYECRPPSPDEVNLMEEHGVELEITPIALDAFVFLRHKDNPVADLTADQVRDIYTRAADGDRGVIDNWQQVGGPDARINAYTRNPNSGSQETLQTLVMKDREVIAGRDIMALAGMMGPYNRIYDDLRGIGFTFFYYQKYMAPLTVSRGMFRVEEQDADKGEPESLVGMFAIDGVAPTRKAIADGSYPWVTEVYVVTRRDLDPDHPAARLRDWLQTEEGQGVVAETGYTPLK